MDINLLHPQCDMCYSNVDYNLLVQLQLFSRNSCHGYVVFCWYWIHWSTAPVTFIVAYHAYNIDITNVFDNVYTAKYVCYEMKGFILFASHHHAVR